FRIVCFGGGQFRGDEIELIRELSIKPRELEQVSGGDNMLAVYYKNAAVFVYPSLYEGFGIPPLEAMALGCPVICSNTSSIPEVVGDSGEYFDPQSIESMSVAVENVLQSTERHAELIRKGFIKCAEYSWDRCAAETMDIYRGLAKLKH
ncbi:MAG: glycosyltransferase, partial [Methylophaga sp.]|nr:glycosyltransferase [Methylophaga sp.]